MKVLGEISSIGCLHHLSVYIKVSFPAKTGTLKCSNNAKNKCMKHREYIKNGTYRVYNIHYT